MKTCTRCGKTRPQDDFSNDRSRSSGKFPQCKPCVRAKCNKWRKDNESFVKEGKRRHREANLEKIREKDRRYYQENREAICDRARQYKKENPELVRETNKSYRERNQEKVKQRKRKYHLENRELFNERARQRSRENPERARQYWHRYKKRPGVKTMKALRSVLSEFYRKAKLSKDESSHRLLGYTPEQLRQRMECQFQPGMTWGNHGEWHIDHKIPVSYFLRKGETRPHIVNALSNLQPLWAEENLSKKDRHPKAA